MSALLSFCSYKFDSLSRSDREEQQHVACILEENIDVFCLQNVGSIHDKVLIRELYLNYDFIHIVTQRRDEQLVTFIALKACRFNAIQNASFSIDLDSYSIDVAVAIAKSADTGKLIAIASVYIPEFDCFQEKHLVSTTNEKVCRLIAEKIFTIAPNAIKIIGIDIDNPRRFHFFEKENIHPLIFSRMNDEPSAFPKEAMPRQLFLLKYPTSKTRIFWKKLKAIKAIRSTLLGFGSKSPPSVMDLTFHLK